MLNCCCFFFPMHGHAKIRMEDFPGLRFCPTDEELVGHYLLRRITGELTAWQYGVIRECDLYSTEEPWELWQRYKLNVSEDVFFFTKLNKKNTGSSRINRKIGAGGGTWHGESGSVIHVSGLTAYKKRFSYRNPSKLDQDRCWNLIEYSMDLEVSNTSDYHVLCQLKMSNRNRFNSKKRKYGLHDEATHGFLPNKRSEIESNKFQESQPVPILQRVMEFGAQKLLMTVS
ncbi:NAC domain-containing protein 105-like [Manihot esculenta]|uniref:NAC domain-containing protein 105-like n=1 Tax=Manihot esculenta TaxID=3983 RepID=UPI001CC7CC82|nr:NAC domain-containing protein 105-like [Manihot esculenta]